MTDKSYPLYCTKEVTYNSIGICRIPYVAYKVKEGSDITRSPRKPFHMTDRYSQEQEITEFVCILDDHKSYHHLSLMLGNMSNALGPLIPFVSPLIVKY